MFLLAFDVGTSSLKATLLTEEGSVINSSSVAYSTYEDTTGVSEQNTDLWWHAVCATSKKLAIQNSAEFNEIAGIGVSGHMLGCVSVGYDGNALSPAMIHSDKRSFQAFQKIDKTIGKEIMFYKTGNILDARSSLSKVLWIKENRPEQYKNTAKFMQSKDFIVFRLTGQMDTTDYSDASHAQWMDVNKREYLFDIFQDLQIDKDKFPTLRKGIDIVGEVSLSAAQATGLKQGIPVIAGGGDGACANIAAGLQSRDIYCSLGTTAWISQNSDEPTFDQQQRLFNISSLDGLHTNVYGTVQNAGKAIEWALGAFQYATPQDLDKAAVTVAAGSDGLLFLPYLDGERSPVFDTNAKGVFLNIGSVHKSQHFARSVIEGTSFALNSILEIFRSGSEIRNMRLIGGGGRSQLWLQILADVMDIKLETLSIPSGDATSIGAGLAAGVGIGLYKDLKDATSRIKISHTTEQQHENRAIYEEQFIKYQQIYAAVKSLF